MGLDAQAIVEAFVPYRPAGMTRRLAIGNLRAKLDNADFRSDLAQLLVAVPNGYTIDTAAVLVRSEVLDRL